MNHFSYFRGNELRKDDADNLRYALAHIPNLEFLDISDNPIQDDGIRSLPIILRMMQII